MEIGITPRQSLPEDIIEEEILSRLTVKSLLRFRCVSKSWRCSIDSQRVVHTHLQKSINNKTLSHHRVLLTYDVRRDVRLCSLLSALSKNRDNIQSLQSNFPTNIPLSWINISIAGCCNGLVCIVLKANDDSKHFMLWNPATRAWRIIDNTPRATRHCGFGWDESNDEYKVIAVEKGAHKYNVYSLKTDSWKEINGPELSLFCSKHGILLGGKLHWESHDTNEIVAFDLKSEVFEMVAPPPYPEGLFFMILGLLGECLSVVHCCYSCVNIWVLKEHCSWEKVIIVAGESSFWTRRPSVNTLCIGDEGGYLLIKTSIILVCDPKTNKLERIDDADECDIYVESLVSPLPLVEENNSF